jgi:hypothetical protein
MSEAPLHGAPLSFIFGPVKRDQAVRIEGVIAEMVGGGTQPPYEVLVMLSPWREVGGAIVKKQLRLEVPHANEAAMLRAMTHYLKARGSAIALKVTGLKPEKRSPWWGEANATRPISAIDPEVFGAAAKELAAERRIRDTRLGTLTLDRGMNWFEGSRKLGSTRYTLAVEVGNPDDDGKVAKAIGSAGSVVETVERDWPKLIGMIADELLDTCNSAWRKEERPVSRRDFIAQLRPNEIVVGPARTTIYIKSGRLFGEHGVEVRLARNGKSREILVS